MATGGPRLRDVTAPPNLLSLLRLLLVPVALWLLSSGNRPAAVCVLAVMAVTDGLDGYVARRTGRVTELGKILDPLADKVSVDSVLLALAVRGEFPVWALAVLVARDLAIAGMAVAVSRRRGGVPASNMVGKVTFVVLVATSMAFAADLRALEVPLLLLAIGFAAASSFSYWRGAVVALASGAPSGRAEER